MLALVLLAIPPILTNTYVGVRQVDRDTVDAARGMGMTGAADRAPGRAAARAAADLRRHPHLGGQRDRHRDDRAARRRRSRSATRSSTPSRYGDDGPARGGDRRRRSWPSSTELPLGAVQRAVTPEGLKLEPDAGARRLAIPDHEEGSDRMKTNRRWRPLIAAAAARASLALAACGDDDDDSERRQRRVDRGPGDRGRDREERRQRVDQAHGRLEELHRAEDARRDLRAGARGRRLQVKHASSTSATRRSPQGARGRRRSTPTPSTPARRCCRSSAYTADKIPKDAQRAYDEAKDGFAKKNLTALPPDAVHELERGRHDRRRRPTSSGSRRSPTSRARSQDLTLYGTPECRQRLDCLLGLEQVYGLKFKKFVPVDIALRHEVLEKGQADVSIVFTTDPQIKRDKEVLLEDDKGMFPPYNSTLVIRDDVLKKAGPDLAEGRRRRSRRA